MSIGSRIKAERERLGMTQEAFAKKVGATRVSVGRWESGFDKNMTTRNLLACARVLGVSVAYLVGETKLPQRHRPDFMAISYNLSYGPSGPVESRVAVFDPAHISARRVKKLVENREVEDSPDVIDVSEKNWVTAMRNGKPMD